MNEEEWRKARRAELLAEGVTEVVLAKAILQCTGALNDIIWIAECDEVARPVLCDALESYIEGLRERLANEFHHGFRMGVETFEELLRHR